MQKKIYEETTSYQQLTLNLQPERKNLRKSIEINNEMQMFSILDGHMAGR